MNLHIVPDNVFINKFVDNLSELEIADRNAIVIRTNRKNLKYVRHQLPFAALYSAEFDELTQDTTRWNKVFVHQFTPLLYRWVAKHDFRYLGWMVWGSDLYNLPSVKVELYEPLTLQKYIGKKMSLDDWLYRAKLALLHRRFMGEAYGKVTDVLTWMKSEYDFAIAHLPRLTAGYQFFFYENDLPYQALDEVLTQQAPFNKRPLFILGNSATAELNHLDAVAWMHETGMQADLYVPVSYGDAGYAAFLRKALSFYKGGELRLIDQYMTFHEYLRFLYRADGLIMNNIRPQGYGNIFMMMYLGKKIFLNEKNFSIPELNRAGLAWQPITRMNEHRDGNWKQNRDAVVRLLSHTTALEVYRRLFS